MHGCLKIVLFLFFIFLTACGTKERPEANSRSGSSSLLSLSPGEDDPAFNEENFNEEFNSEFGENNGMVNGEPGPEQQMSGYEAYREAIRFSIVLPTSVNQLVGSAYALQIQFEADPGIQVGTRWFFNGTPANVIEPIFIFPNLTEANEGLYTIEVFVTEANGSEVPIYRGSCAMFIFMPPAVVPGAGL